MKVGSIFSLNGISKEEFYFLNNQSTNHMKKMKSGPILEQILIELCVIHLGVMPCFQEIGDLVNGTLGKQHMIEIHA
jgi:hypothetical protein